MLSDQLYKLRMKNGLTQEQLSEKLGISRQAIQKWEKGTSVPDTEKLIQLSKLYGVSLDTIVFDSDSRTVEEMPNEKLLRPSFARLRGWEAYPDNIVADYYTTLEEGKDVEYCKNLVEEIRKMPPTAYRDELADVVFRLFYSTPIREDFKYLEPSDYEGIKKLKSDPEPLDEVDSKHLKEHITGAWLGRISGCLLGKALECIRVDELWPFLKESGNYPMHRYVLSTDITPEVTEKYKYRFPVGVCADRLEGFEPVDDDTNYTVLYQQLISRNGRGFSPLDVANAWLTFQRKDAYCTAERVAFCNFIRGYLPPDSAAYKNCWREAIGAQIRADYFGYINPGDPETASNMAWRDAQISHTKNGIYGEMYVAACIAAAAVTGDTEKIVRAGLANIPRTSRMYEKLCEVLEMYKAGKTEKDFCVWQHEVFDDTTHHWVDATPNACIVTASVLWGHGNYGKSICMAVEQGFDTDCNGATVGSIVGMMLGAGGIDPYWTKPFGDTLMTLIFGAEKVKIPDLVETTLKHIALKASEEKA